MDPISTPSGRRLNRVLNEKGVEIKFADDLGRAGSYEEGRNLLWIDNSLAGGPEAAVTLAHEAHHATTNSGLPTVQQTTKEEYATAMLRDEAEARVAEYRFTDELRSDGHDIAPDSLERTYRSLYEDSLDRNQNSGLSQKRLEARAEEEALEGLADHLGDANDGWYRKNFEDRWDTITGRN